MIFQHFHQAIINTAIKFDQKILLVHITCYRKTATSPVNYSFGVEFVQMANNQFFYESAKSNHSMHSGKKGAFSWRARKKSRNDFLFGNFMLLKMANANLTSELGNFYDKIKKIRIIRLNLVF